MADKKGYKCPSCGGAMQFDPASQKLKCPFCGSTFEPAEYDAQNKAEDSGVPGTEWSLNADDMQVFSCNNCGGEVIGDENTGALTCPYCDEPLVLNERFSGSLKPEFVLPFKVDKTAARNAYADYVSKKKLLPAIFKNDKHISDIKGVYVPFWLFDASAKASAEFEGTKETKQGEDTKIEYFSVKRSGDMNFKAIPVDASTRMEDDLMDSIEPFDAKELKPFTPAYLAGFMADKYDVSKEECEKRADKRIKNSAVDVLRESAAGDYTTLKTVSSNVTIPSISAHYALYPVWILSTKWNGSIYRFAMNGQTGKFIGNLPVDKGAYRSKLIVTGIISTVVVFALLLAYWFFK